MPRAESSPSLAPAQGLAVLHLFCRVSAAVDPEAVLAATKEARAAGDQVVTVALLGHKGDIGFMALGPDQWRLRGFQTALRQAGLEVVWSYVSLTEVSEYAAR